MTLLGKKSSNSNCKIIRKDQEYLNSSYFIKFNGAQIKFNWEGIILTKKSYIIDIFLIINYNIDSTNLKRITRKKLLFKE